MSFFSKLTPPHRVGEKNFERARAAEVRKDFGKARQYFEAAAQGFDEHFAANNKSGEKQRPSHLVMAGICYTRLGRNEDALAVLDVCIAQKEIPDAFLHAGYAAAQLSQVNKAVDYWSQYPDWSEERYISKELKAQVEELRNSAEPNLLAASEAVVHASHRQDKKNASDRLSARGKKTGPRNRGY